MLKAPSHSPPSAINKQFDKSQLLHAHLSSSMKHLENLLGEDGRVASRENMGKNDRVADSLAIVLDDSTLPKVDLDAVASSTGLANPKNSPATKRGHFLFGRSSKSWSSPHVSDSHHALKPTETQETNTGSKSYALDQGDIDHGCHRPRESPKPVPRNQWKPSDAADLNRDPIEKVLERVTLDLEIDEEMLKAPSDLDRELNSLVELQTSTRAALLRTRSLQNVARQSSCKQLQRQASLHRK
jgi:hypothetical protein